MDDERSLVDLAKKIKSSERLVVFSGAGLSAESGIPTFRGGCDHPLWSEYDPHKLASAEGFADDPSRVIAWYSWRRGVLAAAEPNAAHRALARCEGATLVTQNVDDLQESYRGAVPGQQSAVRRRLPVAHLCRD